MPTILRERDLWHFLELTYMALVFLVICWFLENHRKVRQKVFIRPWAHQDWPSLKISVQLVQYFVSSRRIFLRKFYVFRGSKMFFSETIPQINFKLGWYYRKTCIYSWYKFHLNRFSSFAILKIQSLGDFYAAATHIQREMKKEWNMRMRDEYF